MAKECPTCHYDNPLESAYCSQCAAPLPGVDDISAFPTVTLDFSDVHLSRGSTFAGRYEIIEEIGQGGMGKIYRVEDTKIKEEVALKLIRPEIAADQRTIERFSNELKFARKIAHKNVCRMYDLGEEKGTHYITMEYVAGENLKQMIRMMGKLSPVQAVSIARQICEGLAEAHRLGVIHRDLKPSNIMIGRQGTAYIMDFGIARSLQTRGKTGVEAMVGTPDYIPPEQADGREVDQRSDLYSLGIILFEMTTGQLPFKGDTPLSVAVKHKNEVPPDPSKLNPHIPEELGLLILKCMEKDKEKRFQNVEELRLELEKIEKRLSSVEKETPAQKPFWLRPITFRKPWVVIAALLALVIASGTVFMLLRRGQPVAASSGLKMLAVLPFENLGAPEDEYFADGITEEITSRLSALHGLGIISRTSALKYKKTEKTIRQIGKELGVDYLLEGTVRWDRTNGGQGRVRVTPQLIRISDDTHLWSESYDRLLQDVFSVQSDIAEQVAKKLDIAVLEPERKALFAQPTNNLQAYDYYLRAIDYYTKGYLSQDLNQHQKALDLLGKAIELDPDFTHTYLLTSQIHSLVYSVGMDRSQERLAKLKASVDRALELEPDLPEAQLALGLYYVHALQDYDRALEIFEAVQKARPNIRPFFLASIQIRKGNWQESIKNLEKAFQINPRSTDPPHSLGRTYAWIGRYDKSEEWFDRALSIYPHLYYSKLGKARLPLLSRGDTKQMRRLLEKLAPHVLTDYNWFLLCRLERNFQEALKRLASTPYDVFAEAHFYIPKNLAYAWIYHAMKKRTKMKSHANSARLRLEKELKERPEDSRLYAALGLAYAYLEQKEEAVQNGIKASKLYPVAKDAFEGPRYVLNLARIYSVVGQYEKAVDQLEYLLSIPSGNFISVAILRLDPDWDPLRNKPRFQQLLKSKHSLILP